MTCATRPDLVLLVLPDGGAWYPGWVEHPRQRADRCEGWVRYTVGVGEQHLRRVDQDQVRRATGFESPWPHPPHPH